MDNVNEEANKDLFEERINICEQCPSLKSFLGQPQCGECKCFLNLKARLKIAKCPLGKW